MPPHWMITGRRQPHRPFTGRPRFVHCVHFTAWVNRKIDFWAKKREIYLPGVVEAKLLDGVSQSHVKVAK